MSKVLRGSLVGFLVSAKDGYTPAINDEVKITDDYEVDVVASGDAPVGHIFAVNKAADNKAASYTVQGNGQQIQARVAGADIAAGARVQFGADQKVITLAAGVCIGVALQAAAVDGDEIDVLRTN